MFPLIFITIAAIQLAYPYVSSDNISGTEPDRDAEYLLHLTEAATLWNEIKMNFVTGFSHGRSKFHDRLQNDHCWSDDINGIPKVQQNAERATQKRQQNQRYRDYNLRGLQPNYLQLKTREQLMECPNANRNDFSTQNIQEDIMLQVCSNFLHDVKQIKTELTTMRQEMRNLRTELQEHRVNCMEGNSRPWAPTQKGNQKTVRFCNYCHKNGHSRNWCRKKMRDEELRKIQNEMSSKRNHVPNQNHGTNAVDRSDHYDQNVDRSSDSDDGNNPTNKLQPAKEEAGQDEPNEITPLEQRYFHMNNGMRFNATQFNSAGKSDDELSDPLPLGY